MKPVPTREMITSLRGIAVTISLFCAGFTAMEALWYQLTAVGRCYNAVARAPGRVSFVLVWLWAVVGCVHRRHLDALAHNPWGGEGGGFLKDMPEQSM